ncbi:MAG: MarR family winged helix-turn-helix transcriptional regulator [Sphaerotilus sulfidivorans]|uniref:MarR family winged helix-turn-helix transcriptional regulator n=1 Tax=Sphaerotilus sulfidivorans TaxID=639200 RepID=UPI003F2EA0EB
MTIPTSDFPAAGPADDIALTDQAGHLIRRAHQLAVALFHENLGRDVTPVQYAVLRALEARPGIDQVTLAAEIALDTSTTAETAVRLERKGWIVRELLARRQRALYLTPEGQALLAGLRAPMVTMQATLMHMLEPGEQQELMRLLRKMLASAAPVQEPLPEFPSSD